MTGGKSLSSRRPLMCSVDQGLDSKELDPDLHKRMQQAVVAAVQNGSIKCCISGMYIVIICIYRDIQVYVGIYVFILEVGCVCS
jgi:hypothetical protein